MNCMWMASAILSVSCAGPQLTSQVELPLLSEIPALWNQDEEGSQPPSLLPEERPGWSKGFSAAGQRTRRADGNEWILDYTLRTTSDPDVESFGELTFVEEWILDQLPQQVPGVSDVEIVDRAEVRHRDGKVTADLVRQLEVRGSQTLLDAAEKFLDRLRTVNEQLVTVSCILLKRSDAPPSPEIEATMLDGARAARRLDSFRDHPGDVLVDAKLSTYGGVTASMHAIDQLAYLQDFELEVIGDTVIADPVVGVLQEGAMLGVTSIVDPARDRVHVQLDLTVAELKRPLDESEVELGPGLAPVTVQIPEIGHVHLTTEAVPVDCESTAGFVLRGASWVGWDDDGTPRRRWLEVLVTVSVEPPIGEVRSVATVEGFDAATRKIFARSRSDVSPSKTGEYEVRRDAAVVGVASVIEARSGFWMLELKEGEAQAGDALTHRD